MWVFVSNIFLNHRDPYGGRGEGGRGLYFLKLVLILGITPPTPLRVLMIEPLQP